MAGEGEKLELRVKTYFPKVKDFERKENGDPIFTSLRGPERIEARQQWARERLIAGGEVKLLQEQLRYCYHKEGVNHYEVSSLKSRAAPPADATDAAAGRTSRHSSRVARLPLALPFLQLCKDIAAQLLDRLKNPPNGMLKVRRR